MRKTTDVDAPATPAAKVGRPGEGHTKSMAMFRRSNSVIQLAVLLGALGLAGCTIFPEAKTPTLANTTSAEQNERIFWQMARRQQWAKLEPLLAANAVWTLPGKTLDRDQIVPYLQTLGDGDSTITGLIVKPNGPDMTLTYSLQRSAKAGAAKAGILGNAANFTVVSVWQQVKSGWVLIFRAEQPAAE